MVMSSKMECDTEECTGDIVVLQVWPKDGEPSYTGTCERCGSEKDMSDFKLSDLLGYDAEEDTNPYGNTD